MAALIGFGVDRAFGQQTLYHLRRLFGHWIGSGAIKRTRPLCNSDAFEFDCDIMRLNVLFPFDCLIKSLHTVFS